MRRTASASSPQVSRALESSSPVSSTATSAASVRYAR
jgi:hypothetical protein